MKTAAEELYADIISLPRHEPDPVKHPRMRRQDRAAQFSPFAALSGFDEVISDRNEQLL